VCVHGYVDLDLASDTNNRGSTNGYMFMMFGGAINWMSKQEPIVGLSMKEVEYMEATHACKESI
jgi:hypothetical protein